MKDAREKDKNNHMKTIDTHESLLKHTLTLVEDAERLLRDAQKLLINSPFDREEHRRAQRIGRCISNVASERESLDRAANPPTMTRRASVEGE